MAQLETSEKHHATDIAQVAQELREIRDNMVRRADLDSGLDALGQRLSDALRLTPRPRRPR